MKPEFEIRADLSKRVVYCRMSGTFDEATMRLWCEAYRRDGTAKFRGRKHMVIADMRGLRPSQPEVANLMGQEIGYARRNGCVLCAHLSDDSVQRLQARRVARMNSPHDDVTVDVVSIEEAQQVVQEGLRRIDDNTPLASIRTA